jgi:tetratricopeptide (TPR) repeat protein/tRNA A-37 threonylcarbamoyl transferase component Bud32
MSPDQWQRLQTVYHNAAELTPPERTPYLEKECSGDARMRQEIERLLDCEEKLGSFLENTAVEALVGMYGADKSEVGTATTPWDGSETDYFIGTVIDDRYVVSEYLGSGGMGEVYRADHRLMGTPVAIKRLADKFRDVKEHRRRFVEEARRAVLLDHENIARIKDVVEESDEVFVIMEFVDGKTLRASLDHAFDLDEFLPIAIQCASALGCAHDRRIVHLDIKPENIMLTGTQKVKVCDFGVARQLSSADVSGSPRQSWTFGGTPAYMAPEVIETNHFDTRADIFSLGVVFYEMLAGKHPFRAEDVQTTTNRIMKAAAPPIVRTNGKLPRRLIRLLNSMLSKEPDMRIRTAPEVIAELEWIRFRCNFLKDAWHGSVEAVKRRPLAVTTVALVMALAVAGIVHFKPFFQTGGRNPDALRYYTEGLGPLRDYYKPENVDSAIGSFNQAVKLDPTYAEAWAGLGGAYSLKYEDTKQQDMLPKAQDACLKSIRFDSKLGQAHVCLGTLAQGKGDYQGAEREFRKATESTPGADDAWRGLALAIEYQKRYEEAEKNYLKAVEIKPNYWASYTWLGKFYNNRGRYPEAIKQYEMAMAYSHNNGLVLYSLGVPYFRMGKFDEAIELFKRAIKIQPTLEKARNNLGAAYFLRRRYSEAIPILKEVASRSNEYVPTGNLARAYWWSGQKDKAIPLYEQAIDQAGSQVEVNPQDSDAHLAMSLYYAMLSDRYRAELQLGIALDAHADVPDAHDLITAAMVYAQLGEPESALDFIGQALHHGLNRVEVVADPEFDGLRGPRLDNVLGSN